MFLFFQDLPIRQINENREKLLTKHDLRELRSSLALENYLLTSSDIDILLSLLQPLNS